MTEYTVQINGIKVSARYSERAVHEIFVPLLEKLTAMQRAAGRRILVMLAAPPGAGKSTLVSFLEKLSRERPGLCPVQAVGMDGFHRRQSWLLSHTVRRDGETIPMARIKGAPETFDLDALQSALSRVAAGEDFPWPAYDRTLHDPVEGALRVTGEIALVEGNYLLLDEPGWRELRAYADYTLFIAADPQRLRGRLTARHLSVGKAPETAAAIVDSDMANARRCLERSAPADLTLRLMDDDTFTVEG